MNFPFAIEVRDHARERARERFPGYKAARIVDEVRDAIKQGRCGYRPPVGILGTGDSWYAWTEDGMRVFAMTLGTDCLKVMSVMKADANLHLTKRNGSGRNTWRECEGRA